MRRSRREVGEERTIRHERLLLAHPRDRLVGDVLGEVIPLLRGLRRLDRHGAVVERGVVLVRLAADEAVEVLEPAARMRPVVERPHRARLPHRHLMALAELRGRVAVQPQRLGERRAVLGRNELYPGAEVAISVMPPMPTVWWLRPDRSAARVRRAERGRVEARELEAVRGEPFGARRLARDRRTRSMHRSRRRRGGR